MSAPHPSLAYTADKDWHLTGGEVERLTHERDEARAERDRLRLRLARREEATGFDEALETLVSEAEAFGLTRQAEKAQTALAALREAVDQASEREAAMAEVHAAEEALRLAREKAALAAPAKRTHRKHNISAEGRERLRENGRKLAAARRAKLDADRVA